MRYLKQLLWKMKTLYWFRSRFARNILDQLYDPYKKVVIW